MADQETSLFKFSIKYGAIGALISIAITVILFVLDKPDTPIGQISSLLLIVGVILWAQIDYRRKEAAPVFYTEALGLGVWHYCSTPC